MQLLGKTMLGAKAAAISCASSKDGASCSKTTRTGVGFGSVFAGGGSVPVSDELGAGSEPDWGSVGVDPELDPEAAEDVPGESSEARGVGSVSDPELLGIPSAEPDGGSRALRFSSESLEDHACEAANPSANTAAKAAITARARPGLLFPMRSLAHFQHQRATEAIALTGFILGPI